MRYRVYDKTKILGRVLAYCVAKRRYFWFYKKGKSFVVLSLFIKILSNIFLFAPVYKNGTLCEGITTSINFQMTLALAKLEPLDYAGRKFTGSHEGNKMDVIGSFDHSFIIEI